MHNKMPEMIPWLDTSIVRFGNQCFKRNGNITQQHRYARYRRVNLRREGQHIRWADLSPPLEIQFSDCRIVSEKDAEFNRGIGIFPDGHVTERRLRCLRYDIVCCRHRGAPSGGLDHYVDFDFRRQTAIIHFRRPALQPPHRR